jgi:cell division protein FtsB
MSLVLFLKAFWYKMGRRVGIFLAMALVAAYGWIALRGPQGIQALLEKRREIRQLQEQNATLSRENDKRRERIRRLENNTSEQEMEIRKQLKLLRPGETTFILPDPGPSAPKDAPAPE